jgi:APA family basic amino acid/polyamine antiporter
VAAVLFTYDGWMDVSHVAGEVSEPRKNLPLGLGLGVAGITVLYLIVNHAYLRVVPLSDMRDAPTTVATSVALAAFGPEGGQLLNALITLSILGALGGLVMTIPRMYYAVAAQYHRETTGSGLNPFFRTLARVSSQSAVPVGAIVFSAALSIGALVFFGTFRRIVTFFVVPLHVSNILVVASVFRLRAGAARDGSRYLAPGYPLLPAVYIGVLSLFLLSAILYNALDTFIGIAMTASGIPVYLFIRRSRQR